jgi:signal transduction histidine kinase
MSEAGMREQAGLLVGENATLRAASQPRVEVTHAEETRADKPCADETRGGETPAKEMDTATADHPGGPLEGAAQDFGAVLRHELNNPLTGILGNAELLLAEIRRSDDGRMPRGGSDRVETIAALAVRLRETIRRLSQEWEARNATTRGNVDA